MKPINHTNITIFALISVCFAVHLEADTIVSIDKIIKSKRTYYEFNGTRDIKVSQTDCDLIKESGVILSKEKEAQLKGKKTPEELRKSMAKLPDVKEGDIDKLTSKPKTISSDEVSIGRVVVIKKDNKTNPRRKTKRAIINTLYHQGASQ